MAAKRKMYTADFKREAVSLITDHGYGVSEAARNLGLHANMLRKWKRTLVQEGAQAFPGNGRLSPEQEALHRLRQENTRRRMEREIVKQAALFFRQRGELRDTFIATGQTIWPVSLLCEVMQVSRSGLYADARRQANRTIDGATLALLARVNAMARETRQSDGSRRMATQLQAEGLSVGRSTARRLRQEAGVAVRRPKARGPVTTDSRHGDGVTDNVLARQFDVAKPDQAWAGDITDIWTEEGW